MDGASILMMAVLVIIGVLTFVIKYFEKPQKPHHGHSH